MMIFEKASIFMALIQGAGAVNFNAANYWMATSEEFVALRGSKPVEDGIADSTRSLRPSNGLVPFSLQSTNDTSVTVRLRQSFFGDEAKCGENAVDPDDVALLIFAIYNPPQSVASTSSDPRECEVFFKQDACWMKDLEIGCDPITGKATIDLYVRDFKLSQRDQVPNPKVIFDDKEPQKTCIGPLDIVGFTIKETATFDCLNMQCQDNSDCVSGEQFCGEEMIDDTFGLPQVTRKCMDYASVGDECGGSGMVGTVGRCNPEEAVCVNTGDCFGITDVPGVCKAFSGTCFSNSDCADPENEYCSFAQPKGLCLSRRDQGECCIPSLKNCAPGTFCRDPFGAGFGTCEP